MNVFHLPLAQRKTICGRLLYFQAAYPGRLNFVVAGAESEFDQVRDNVFRLTEQAVSSSEDRASRSTNFSTVFTPILAIR